MAYDSYLPLFSEIRALIAFRIAFHKSDTRFGNRNILYCEKKIQANTIRKIAISNDHGCARQNNTTVKPFHNRPTNIENISK